MTSIQQVDGTSLSLSSSSSAPDTGLSQKILAADQILGWQVRLLRRTDHTNLLQIFLSSDTCLSTSIRDIDFENKLSPVLKEWTQRFGAIYHIEASHSTLRTVAENVMTRVQEQPSTIGLEGDLSADSPSSSVPQIKTKRTSPNSLEKTVQLIGGGTECNGSANSKPKSAPEKKDPFGNAPFDPIPSFSAEDQDKCKNAIVENFNQKTSEIDQEKKEGLKAIKETDTRDSANYQSTIAKYVDTQNESIQTHLETLDGANQNIATILPDFEKTSQELKNHASDVVQTFDHRLARNPNKKKINATLIDENGKTKKQTISNPLFVTEALETFVKGGELSLNGSFWREFDKKCSSSYIYNNKTRYAITFEDDSGKSVTACFTGDMIPAMHQLSQNYQSQQALATKLANEETIVSNSIDQIALSFTNSLETKITVLSTNKNSQISALDNRNTIISDGNKEIETTRTSFQTKRNDLKTEYVEHIGRSERYRDNIDLSLRKDYYDKTAKDIAPGIKKIEISKTETQIHTIHEGKTVTYNVPKTHSCISIADAFVQYSKGVGPLRQNSSSQFWSAFTPYTNKNFKADENKIYAVTVTSGDGTPLTVCFSGEDIPALTRMFDEDQHIKQGENDITYYNESIRDLYNNQEKNLNAIYYDNRVSVRHEELAISGIKQKVKEQLDANNNVIGITEVTNASQRLAHFTTHLGGGKGLSLQSLEYLRSTVNENLSFLASTSPKTRKADSDGSLVSASDDEIDSGDSETSASQEEIEENEAEHPETSTADTTTTKKSEAEDLAKKKLEATLMRLDRFLDWAGIENDPKLPLEDQVTRVQAEYARLIIEGQHLPISKTLDHFKVLFEILEYKNCAKAAEIAKLGNDFISQARTACFYADLVYQSVNRDGNTVSRALTLVGGSVGIKNPILAAIATIGEPTAFAIALGARIFSLLLEKDKAPELPPLTQKAFFAFANQCLMPMLNDIKEKIESSRQALEEQISGEASSQILALNEFTAALSEQLQSQFDDLKMGQRLAQLTAMTGNVDNFCNTFEGETTSLRQIHLHLERGRIDANNGLIGTTPHHNLPLSVAMQKPSHTTAILASHLGAQADALPYSLPILKAAVYKFIAYAASASERSPEFYALQQRLAKEVQAHLNLFGQTDRCLNRLFSAYLDFKGALIERKGSAQKTIKTRLTNEVETQLAVQRMFLRQQFVGRQMFHWSDQLEKPTDLVAMEEPCIIELTKAEEIYAVAYPLSTVYRLGSYGLHLRPSFGYGFNPVEPRIRAACQAIEQRSIKQLALGSSQLPSYPSLPLLPRSDEAVYHPMRLRRRIWINSTKNNTFASETTIDVRGVDPRKPLTDLTEITLQDAKHKPLNFKDLFNTIRTAFLKDQPKTPSEPDQTTVAEKPLLALDVTLKPATGEWKVDTLESSQLTIQDIQKIPSVSKSVGSSRAHLMGNVLGLLSSDAQIAAELSRCSRILPKKQSDCLLFLPSATVEALLEQECPQRSEIQASGADIIPRHSFSLASDGYYDLKLHLCYADINGDRSYKTLLLSRIDQDTVDCFRRPTSKAPYLDEFLYTYLFSGCYREEGMPNRNTYVNHQAEIFAPDLTPFVGFINVIEAFPEHIFVFNHFFYHEHTRAALEEAIKTGTILPEVSMFFKKRREFRQEVDTANYTAVQKTIRQAVNQSAEFKEYKKQYEQFMAHTLLTTQCTKQQLEDLLLSRAGMIPPGTLGTYVPSAPIIREETKPAIREVLDRAPSDDKAWLASAQAVLASVR